MKTATMKLQMTTRKVWVGTYGGHYTIIVIFNKKPEKRLLSELDASQRKYHPNSYYDCLENDNLIAGSMSSVDFETAFGFVPAATATEIETVELMELTAPFDKNGKLTSIEFHADGWGD